MRISLRRSFVAVCCFTALGLSAAPAQEPTPTPTPAPDAPAPDAPAPTEPTAEPDAPADNPRPRRRPRPVIVIEASAVHPVAGPMIENGVVVIRGDRIVAVGKKGEVEVPENATVQS